MKHFADKLIEQIQKKKTPICLGLDPHLDLIPENFKKNKSTEKIIEEYLIKILDACYEHVACCKPNYAFFEEFGWQGIRAFENVCEHAKKLNLLVIVDGKRNDIGSTASASARAFLSRDIFDALTITPYLGEDGIKPFAELCKKNNKGIFVLVKTSNRSGGEFQDLPVGENLLHEVVASAVSRWGADDLGKSNFSSIGAVVGATYSDEIRILRNEMPSQIFLVPGYGAQGGNAEDVFPAFYKGGNGAIVNSSRGIIFASSDNDFEKAAQKAAIKAKEEFSPIFEK